MLPLDDYYKFVRFIGEDWVKDCYLKFKENIREGGHPFIIAHDYIINSNTLAKNYREYSLPKNVYMQRSLMNYQKYSLIGSIIDRISDKIPNSKQLKERLKNEKTFHGTIYELLSVAILINNSYKIEFIKPEPSKSQPDFTINKGGEKIGIEVTSKADPPNISSEYDAGNKLVENTYEYMYSKKLSGLLYISTCDSYKRSIDNILQLCKEVINKNESGEYIYCDGKIKITLLVNEHIWDKNIYTNWEQNEIAIHPMFMNNLNYCIFYEGDLKGNFKNIIEIMTNYEEIDIHSSIINTIKNKIDKKQILEGLPHYLFMHLPFWLNQRQTIEIERIEDEIMKILNDVNYCNGIVFIKERFGKDRNNAWSYWLEFFEIQNENKEIENRIEKLNLKEFEKETIQVV